MTTTFITGANKGLGRETARRLVEAGHTVLLGARDREAGRRAAEEVGARFVQIDVTDEASVAAAAADVEAHEGVVDVLVNNAGVAGSPGGPADLTADDVAAVFDVNLLGVVRTTRAFLPLLRRSDDPVVVNVASGLGSTRITHDPSRIESTVVAPAYTASKAALIMLTTQYAKGLPDVRSNVVDPGYTATDLNGHSGPQTVTEGTDAVVRLATEGPGHGSGRFLDRHGEIAWG
ncbi:SDR family NAD(P)-dependent oxidoreductase [Quadrisphaera setariae]|uniref:SDR family NAD(P)-dependent oxidoreductase n=1 Tax=Quadrisphaera setariae TaxID=2593304 RepID=A0A5C8ZCE4_9ACTN|nr:SDR family NAD(P)-dependent oxidoreductase [Quadrisphaera setariae]TXR55467.1 SDR family NAD(P)-dependent oxidoreductase [Quadrisphaera setariae]